MIILLIILGLAWVVSIIAYIILTTNMKKNNEIVKDIQPKRIPRKKDFENDPNYKTYTF